METKFNQSHTRRKTMNKLKNIGIEVYIYKPNNYNSMVVENPEMIRNTKSSDFERITLILSAETVEKYGKLIRNYIHEEENQ